MLRYMRRIVIVTMMISWSSHCRKTTARAAASFVTTTTSPQPSGNTRVVAPRLYSPRRCLVAFAQGNDSRFVSINGSTRSARGSSNTALRASNKDDDEEKPVNNVKLRHAAFDALIFADEEEEDDDDTTVSQEQQYKDGVPRASTFPENENRYKDNNVEDDISSPFDFGDLEESYDWSDDGGSATSVDESPSSFDFGALEDKRDDSSLSSVKNSSPPNMAYSLNENTLATSRPKATLSQPQQDTSDQIVASNQETQQPKPTPPLQQQEEKSQTAASQERRDFMAEASSGTGVSTEIEVLQSRLKQLESEIYALNNKKEFNINSPKQVSQVLFGKHRVQSTNKETLEAMGAAGNVMADRILQWRACFRSIKRQERKPKQRVSNVMRSHTPNSGEEPAEDDALLLVDASAYIFRAYYSMPPLHRADGMPVGAVLGFCNMLNRLVLHRLLRGECPRLVLVFDAKGKTFRHDLYQDYKANRKDCPMDLIPQFDLIRHVATAYGIQQLEAESYEADDVIATLATMAIKDGLSVNIMSGDKDLMQLVTPEGTTPSVNMIDPMSLARIDHNAVVEKWGVPPAKVADLLALAGDASDNVPGIPGIGPKIASQLLEQFGSLENLLQEADTIPQTVRREKILRNTDMALLSRKLVELERQIPVENMTFPLEAENGVLDLRMEHLDSQKLVEFFDTMGFRDLKRRFQDRLTQRDRKEQTSRRPRFNNNNRRQKAEIPKPQDYDQVPF